jgi:hypothetical protein
VIWENRWASRLQRALRQADAYVILDELVTAEDLIAYGADLVEEREPEPESPRRGKR